MLLGEVEGRSPDRDDSVDVLRRVLLGQQRDGFVLDLRLWKANRVKGLAEDIDGMTSGLRQCLSQGAVKRGNVREPRLAVERDNDPRALGGVCCRWGRGISLCAWRVRRDTGQCESCCKQ